MASDTLSLKLQLTGTHFGLVVAPAQRVCGGQDGRARVEGGLDTSLGDGDGLLLHGLCVCETERERGERDEREQGRAREQERERGSVCVC